MSKHAVSRLAVGLAILAALLAAIPVFAQPLRTSAYGEIGGAGLAYGLGVERELARAAGFDLRVRAGASALPNLIGTGTVATVSAQFGVTRQLAGRVGVELAAGATGLAARRARFLFSERALDTLVVVPTLGLALRVAPSAEGRVGGHAGVTCFLSRRERWRGVPLPTLGATYAL